MNETQKHTPGPLSFGPPVAYGRDIRDAQGRWLGTSHNPHDTPALFPTHDECEANAHLWCVATDLLAACQLALSAYDFEHTPKANAMCGVLRAAIAKASGGAA